MKLEYYSYANIVRILYVDEEDFSESVMVDVDINKATILSIFKAKKQFDSDFIKSFINILRVSTTGFSLLMQKSLSDSHDSKNTSSDFTLIDKALNIANQSDDLSIKKLFKIL